MYDSLKRGVDPYADADATRAVLLEINKVFLPVSAAGNVISPVKGKISGVITIANASDVTLTVEGVATAALTATPTSGSAVYRPTDPTSPTFEVEIGDTIAIAGTLGVGTSFIEITQTAAQ